MNAYRQAADMPPADAVEEKPKPVAQLVRFTGCQCTPPGMLWCWWNNVGPYDKWICEHGSLWERGVYNGMWHFRSGATQPSSEEKP